MGILLRPGTLFAAVFLIILLFLAVFGPSIVHYSPTTSNVANALQPPGAEHWAGTDQLGRDVLTRVIVATRLDLSIAFFAVAISFVIGATIGGISGYTGGVVDRWISRTVDVLMAFPLFVLAMALVAAFGNSVQNVVLATAIINLPFYIRYARAEVNMRRGFGWVEAARASGNSHWRIILFFLLPNILPGLAVQISLNLGWAILNAAGLSFIGLGVTPPTPEWGIMIAEGARYITAGNWWLIAAPGFMLMMSVLSFNLLGDAARDFLDPGLRR